MQSQVWASLPALILKQTCIPMIYVDLSSQSSRAACDLLHQRAMQSRTLIRDQRAGSTGAVSTPASLPFLVHGISVF